MEFSELRESGLLKSSFKFSDYDLRSYLHCIYFILLNTPNLLLKAKARAKTEFWVRYFEEKFHEENGHYVWAFEDLRKRGDHYLREELVKPQARALVEYANSLLTSAEVFAYGFTVEEVTSRYGEEFEALMVRSGLKMSDASAISKHIELDVHHIAEGEEVLCQLSESEILEFQNARSKTLELIKAFFDAFK